MKQDQAPLAQALEAYNQNITQTFGIPGHRRGAGISPWWTARVGTEIFRYDLTETTGTDDLHAPEAAILQAQQLAAEAFGADETYFLVNGTTCGVEAMLLAAAGPGDKVILARNAHKSALMGLVLCGAQPVYIQPDFLQSLGCIGAVQPETVQVALEENPGAKAVLIVNPTYEGACSDLRQIAEICHRYGALLLVDEAHGAHLHFAPMLPQSAIDAGADLCAQSLHKTGGSLGQSSLLQVRKGRVAVARLRAALQMVQSTSPSYLLMTSLDLARRELALHGAENWERTRKLAVRTRAAICRLPGYECPGAEAFCAAGAADYDVTRLCISACGRGINGAELKERLYAMGIDFELSNDRYVLAIFTPATTEEEARRLIDALAALPENAPIALQGSTFPPAPPQAVLPREAFFAPKQRVPLELAEGAIAGEAVIPYPPGIPVICPGEQITAPVLAFLLRWRDKGGHIQGIADPTMETIQTVLCK